MRELAVQSATIRIHTDREEIQKEVDQLAMKLNVLRNTY